MTCVDDGGFCGWGAPNFPVLRDAWRDIKAELDPFIAEVRESEWTINFKSGGRLECWSLDSGIVARGRKYHKFILDEAGLIPNLGARFDAEIEPTLGDYDGTLIVGSTPNLVGPDLLTWFNLGQRPGTGWKSWRWTSLDNPAVSANMAKLIEGARSRGVPEWIIRQEYYAEPAESDRAFFRTVDLERHRTLYQSPPIARGALDVCPESYADRFGVLKERRRGEIRWLNDASGPWRIWEHPQPDERYAMSADIAYGVGSSNTAFSIGKVSSRRKVAEFAWPGCTPDEAAMLATVAAVWYGSAFGNDWLPAVNCFERNGPGEMFAKQMLDLGNTSLWYDRKSPTNVQQSMTKRYGWQSSADAKEYLLGNLRAALNDGRFINPSDQALSEYPSYQYDDQMRVTAPFDRTKARDDPARVKHGDRVIADALLNLCLDWTPDLPEPPRPAFTPTAEHPDLPDGEDDGGAVVFAKPTRSR